MTGWKSLSVATRLMLAFGVVISLAMVGTGMALQALSGVQTHFEEVMHRHGLLIDLGGRMSTALYASTESLRDATLLADPAARAEGLQRLKERRKVLNDVIAEARKVVDEPQETAALDTLVAALKAGRAASGLALEMVADGKLEDANRQVADKVLPSIPPVQKAVEAFVALEVQLRDKALAEGQSDYLQARNTLLAGAVFIVLLAATVSTLVTRSITRQLGGEPALAVEVASAVSHGDLSHTIRTTPGDAESLMAQLKLMQDSLVRLVSTVRKDAEGVAAAAAQVAQGSQDLSERTEQQAASLQQTAASMEQLGSAVHQNSDHARQASQYAHEAAGVAVKGGEVVNEVVQTMKTIDDSAHRIAEIIGTVDSIAFQTNILALNAAVEAARAGEQGRGFAVVAGEVRTLAQRTTDAAREIKTLIGDSVERVGHGSALVQQAGATMAEIVASIQRVRDVMDDITTASTQQSDGVTQASAAVAQMDQATQQNASLVEESTAAARELNRQADELVGAVRAFRLS